MKKKHQHYHEIEKPFVLGKNIDETETRHGEFADVFESNEIKIDPQKQTINNSKN